MSSSSLVRARAALVAAALVVLGAPAASAGERPANMRAPVADGKLAGRTATAPASPSHHGPSAGHLPPRSQELEVVGRLEPSGEFGPILPGQIADLAVHKGFAYLNSWDNPDCERGGTYVVDIRNPSQPQEVGFIPAVDPYYHGEGAHAISINTPSFQGDILAVNNETYGSNLTLNSPCAPADKRGGGFDLYDVTNPANPVPLVQAAGDFSPDDGTVTPDPSKLAPSSYHSVFVWQDGPRAYLVGVDNIELHDVDIFDITDPRNPEFIADIDLVEDFPQIVGLSALGNDIFHHDVVVKRIGGQMRMLVSYWDAGYVQLDVSNPASPTHITDTSFDFPDLLTGFDPPEGNAHQAEYSHDNQFILAADEDFAPYRLIEEIGGAPADPPFGFGVPVTAGGSPIPELQIAPGEPLAGDTVFIGTACDPAAIPAPPGPGTIAVAERGGTAPGGGACGFELKAINAEDAGYEGLIIFNNVAPAGPTTPVRCEVLFNMTFTNPPVVGIKTIFVGRRTGLQILGVLDPATYTCVEGDEAASTDSPPVGTNGQEVELSAAFDSWGYAHLYDASTSAELDAFAIPEALDERFADGFGDLSIHEFATDPETNLAYVSYYSGGIRVLRFSRAGGLEQVGAWISGDVDGQGPGSNFWGVEQFTTASGERLIAGSDRDYGLVILRYTGPGAPQPAAPGGPGGGPGGPSGAPSNALRLRVGRYRRGRLTLVFGVDAPGRLRVGLRANLPRVGAARVVRLARRTRDVAAAGQVRMTLRLSLSARRRLGRALSQTGRVRAKLNVAWTPTGGTTRRTSRTLRITR